MDKIFKAYVYKNMFVDLQRFLRKNVKQLKNIDFDREALLHKVGLAEYNPGKAAFTGVSMLVLGGIVGAAIALALAPKAGVELRSDLRNKAQRMFERQQAGMEMPAQA